MEPTQRARAHELGIHVGQLPSGSLDAITDVRGVSVGHATRRAGALNTGVTVVLPHGENPLQRRLNAALEVQNGFGKFVGATQLMELGELESPIALTSTLSVHRVADAVLDWVLAQPGNEHVTSVNVVVGETNDGQLSDIRQRAVGADEVAAAMANAAAGAFAVGSVGAGAGTTAFGWKGGIGTSSRLVDGFTIGVLVQTNFGGRLIANGAEVTGEWYSRSGASPQGQDHGGSCVIVIAVDAPLDQASLGRIARRSFAGMARTGASFSHGSGDYAVAFSTASQSAHSLRGDALSGLFVAVADAAEQAILDSLSAAVTTAGPGQKAVAIPHEALRGLPAPD
ncbi:MAG: P1 family peptidase [Planctomycetota bacterium]